MNRLSRRVADLHHARQRRLLGTIDQSASGIVRIVGTAWQRLLTVLREPQGYAADYGRALAVLRQLCGETAGALADRLTLAYRQAHATAARSVLDARPLTEDRGDDYLELLIGAPADELVWRALAPLIRPADWETVGDGANRKMPQELAQMVAGGMLRGETQRDIAKAVRPYLDGSRVRAARVARTFGLHVVHVAQMDAWSQLGDVVVGYEIHATISPCPPSRPWHQKRSGTVYYKQPEPGQKGLAQMPRPPMEAPDASERPAGTPQIAWNCMLPGQEVQGRFVAASKAFYAGKALELRTAFGRTLRVTANHPILTQDGFVPANCLCKGDHLVRYELNVSDLPQHKEYAPAPVEDVFGAIKEFGRMITTAPGISQFHGDARSFEGQVEVVLAQRKLPAHLDADNLERRRKGDFVRCGCRQALVTCLGTGDLYRFGIGLTTASLLRGGGLAFSRFGRHLGHLHSAGFGPAANLHACRYEPPGKAERPAEAVSDTAARHPRFFGKLLKGFPHLVTADKIIKVRQFDFAGHVYDLQGDGGWIVANNIFISNCKCYLTPVLDVARLQTGAMVTRLA